MKRLIVALLFVVASCGDDAPGATDDAAPPDAAPPDATVDAMPPDATYPDATPQFCHHKTKGVFIGDTITQDFYLAAREKMQEDGDVVLKIAVAGAKIEDQYHTWMDSTLRGDASIDWIFVQAGIFNIIGGPSQSAEQDASVMQVLLGDIHEQNPNALIFFATMDPARGHLDGVGADRYPLWQDLQGRYIAMGAEDTISQGLNDGTGALAPNYNQGDGLRPNLAGYLASAAIVQQWLDDKFPDIPCEE